MAIDLMGPYLTYVVAWEQAYASDDWSLLTPYFTEDAIYEIEGSDKLAGRHAGRATVLGFFKNITTQFDKRFDRREIVVLGVFPVGDDKMRMTWIARYHLSGVPPLEITGEELAIFAGHRIAHLYHRLASGTGEIVGTFMAQHGARLRQ